MSEFSIRITHRHQQDLDPAETTIEIDGPKESTSYSGFIDIPSSLELRTAPSSPALEWSGTLCNSERVDYATAEKACAVLGEGWRLPTRQELESILDLTRHDPAIDAERFPGTESGWYWTSTPCAWSSDLAWVVNFSNGLVLNPLRVLNLAFVRAVRSVPAGQ